MKPSRIDNQHAVSRCCHDSRKPEIAQNAGNHFSNGANCVGELLLRNPCSEPGWGTLLHRGEVETRQGPYPYDPAGSADSGVRENFYGRFARQVTLPEGAYCEQAKAEFANGIDALTE